MTAAWKRRAKAPEPEPTRAELPKRELVEPTAGEKRNGWTAETLTAYRESIAPEVAALFMRREPALPVRSHPKYSPLRQRLGGRSPFARMRGR